MAYSEILLGSRPTQQQNEQKRQVYMGACRHGQRRAPALLWKMYRLDSLHLQHFGSHNKYQNCYHKIRLTAQNILKLRSRPWLCPRPHWGSLHRFHRPYRSFKGIRRFTTEKKRQSKRAGRGEEEWRRSCREGKERDEVDFASSCKNSAGAHAGVGSKF